MCADSSETVAFREFHRLWNGLKGRIFVCTWDGAALARPTVSRCSGGASAIWRRADYLPDGRGNVAAVVTSESVQVEQVTYDWRGMPFNHPRGDADGDGDVDNDDFPPSLLLSSSGCDIRHDVNLDGTCDAADRTIATNTSAGGYGVLSFQENGNRFGFQMLQQARSVSLVLYFPIGCGTYDVGLGRGYSPFRAAQPEESIPRVPLKPDSVDAPPPPFGPADLIPTCEDVGGCEAVISCLTDAMYRRRIYTPGLPSRTRPGIYPYNPGGWNECETAFLKAGLACCKEGGDETECIRAASKAYADCRGFPQGPAPIPAETPGGLPPIPDGPFPTDIVKPEWFDPAKWEHWDWMMKWKGCAKDAENGSGWQSNEWQCQDLVNCLFGERDPKKTSMIVIHCCYGETDPAMRGRCIMEYAIGLEIYDLLSNTLQPKEFPLARSITTSPRVCSGCGPSGH